LGEMGKVASVCECVCLMRSAEKLGKERQPSTDGDDKLYTFLERSVTWRWAAHVA
jgi:hypothetical protein